MNPVDEGEAPFKAFERVPGTDYRSGYFDRPVIKEPVWIWAVPAYFYAGGAAGAAAVLGATAQIADGQQLRDLVERCRVVAAIGGATGSVLLIHDLGRPERFLNMLRVFRPSSPLSVGSWILAGAVPLMTASALLARADGAARTTGDLAGIGAGILGLPLTAYTAVLLSNTAVPAWQNARRTLPWLFAASAAAGAASLLEMTDLQSREHRIVKRFALIAKLGDLAAMAAVARDASRVERVGRPYKQGASGSILRTATALTAAGIVVSALGTKDRWIRMLGGALGTAAAAAFKWGVFEAGKASARDPQATFESQRAGFGGREI